MKIAQDFDRIGKPRRGGIRQMYFLDEPGRRLILAKYDGRTETIDELAQRLCVPRWKIKRWASDFGLARQKEPQWTAEEETYLESYIHSVSIANLAKRLGRTKTAVRLKAKRLGVNKTLQEGYTLRGICIGLGVDHHKVRTWIANGWLKARKRHTERERDVWYFSDTAIRDFVAAHPLEIDPRRADWLWLIDVLLSKNGGQNGLGELANPSTEKEVQ